MNKRQIIQHYKNIHNEDMKRYNENISLISKLIESDSFLIVKYVTILRKCEMYQALKSYGKYYSLLYYFWHWKLNMLSYKLGFQIPLNVFDGGLRIYHFGRIIVNGKAKVGKNCTLQPGIVIGNRNPDEVPVIGDNLYMSPGSMILGRTTIGNNVKLAPNAVVITDIPDNVLVAGNPAKIIKYY